MKGVMSTVNEADMELIANWLTSLPTDKGIVSNQTLVDTGAKLFKEKTCTACHGADAKTPIMPIYPKIVGQNQEYVLAQMKDIKSGARNNGQTAAMKGVMHLVSDDEMIAIAEWLASLGGDL
jgi:cytochrome c